MCHPHAHIEPAKSTISITCSRGKVEYSLLLNVGETVKVGGKGRVHACPYDARCPTGPPRTSDLIKSSAEIVVSQEKPVGEVLFSCTNTCRVC